MIVMVNAQIVNGYTDEGKIAGTSANEPSNITVNKNTTFNPAINFTMTAYSNNVTTSTSGWLSVQLKIPVNMFITEIEIGQLGTYSSASDAVYNPGFYVVLNGNNIIGSLTNPLNLNENITVANSGLAVLSNKIVNYTAPYVQYVSANELITAFIDAPANIQSFVGSITVYGVKVS